MSLPPIAIGGIGGSGTRLLASILQDVGYYIGDDLGKPLDNLWFTLLLKRRDLWPLEDNQEAIKLALQIFLNAMTAKAPFTIEQVDLIHQLSDEARLHHPLAWRQARRDSLLSSPNAGHRAPQRWGWKEPNTHLFLPLLEQEIPRLKYIHVMRHGLDMAISTNQNQLVFWGPKYLGIRAERHNPMQSLRFWCEAHRKVLETGADMTDRFLLLNFDELCDSPEDHLPTVLNFIEAAPNLVDYEAIAKSIKRPTSIGRRRWLKQYNFDLADIDFVESMGFKVD